MSNSLSELQDKIDQVEEAMVRRFRDRCANTQIFDGKGVQVGMLRYTWDVPSYESSLIFFPFKDGKLERGRSAAQFGEEVLRQILTALPTLVRILQNQSDAHTGALRSGDQALRLMGVR